MRFESIFSDLVRFCLIFVDFGSIYCDLARFGFG